MKTRVVITSEPPMAAGRINRADVILGSDFNKLSVDSATLRLLLYEAVAAADATGTPTRSSNGESYSGFSLVLTCDSILSRKCRLRLSLPANIQIRTMKRDNTVVTAVL